MVRNSDLGLQLQSIIILIFSNTSVWEAILRECVFTWVGSFNLFHVLGKKRDLAVLLSSESSFATNAPILAS